MISNIELKLAKANDVLGDLIAAEIEKRIRTKYTLSNELAILRQRDAKPEEFEEYNDFVEKCKAEVKAELYI